MDLDEKDYDYIYDSEAEEVTIMAMMLGPFMGNIEPTEQGLKDLKKWDFYRPRNRWAFESIRILHENGEKVTKGNVAFMMKGISGGHYIDGMLNTLLGNANRTTEILCIQRCDEWGVSECVKQDPADIEFWLPKVRDASRKRSLFSLLSRIWDDACDGKSIEKHVKRLGFSKDFGIKGEPKGGLGNSQNMLRDVLGIS